jgi:phenol 2-monooxygenase
LALCIHYDASIINVAPTATMVNPGHRGPDTLLHPAGAWTPVHLFRIAKRIGAFWVIVFAGFPTQTSAGMHALRTYLDNPILSFVHKMQPGAFRFLTIIAGSANQAKEALDVPAFGDSYYDLDNSAHSKEFRHKQGLSLSLRPDGMFGFATTLDGGRGFVAKHLPRNKAE